MKAGASANAAPGTTETISNATFAWPGLHSHAMTLFFCKYTAKKPQNKIRADVTRPARYTPPPVTRAQNGKTTSKNENASDTGLSLIMREKRKMPFSSRQKRRNRVYPEF
jgi:hypothetical protein